MTAHSTLNKPQPCSDYKANPNTVGPACVVCVMHVICPTSSAQRRLDTHVDGASGHVEKVKDVVARQRILEKWVWGLEYKSKRKTLNCRLIST